MLPSGKKFTTAKIIYTKFINLDYSRVEFARLPRSARNDDVILNI